MRPFRTTISCRALRAKGGRSSQTPAKASQLAVALLAQGTDTHREGVSRAAIASSTAASSAQRSMVGDLATDRVRNHEDGVYAVTARAVAAAHGRWADLGNTAGTVVDRVFNLLMEGVCVPGDRSR